jgi:HEAT repeat protein
VVALAAEMMKKGTPAQAERAAWMLGDWGSPASIGPLLAACGHQDAGVRAQAAAALGRLGDLMGQAKRKAVVGKLEPMASSGDRRAMISAIRALAKLGGFDDLDALAAHADSQDTELAVAAIRTLGRSGSRRSFGLFSPALLSERPDLVLAAIEATGSLSDALPVASDDFGNAELADELVDKLNAQSAAVRIAAVHALVALATQNEEHLGVLVGFLSPSVGPGSVRREALMALTKLGGEIHEPQYLKATQDPDYAVRLTAAQAIGLFRLVGGLGETVALFADTEFYVRQEAVEAVLAIADDDKGRVVDAVAKGLTSATPEVRECSSQVLGRLGSDANFDAHKGLLTDRHVPARRWAAWGMGEIGKKEAIQNLRDCAFLKMPKGKGGAPTWDQTGEASACAILSLAKLGDTESVPNMHALLGQTPTSAGDGPPNLMRVASARALGMLQNEGSAGILIERLNDTESIPSEEDNVRLACVVALGRIGSVVAAGHLRKHMGPPEGRSASSIKIACQWALTRIEGREPPLTFKTFTTSGSATYFLRHQPPRE